MAPISAHALNARSVYGNTGRAIGSDRDAEVTVFRTAISKLRPFMGPDFSLTPDAAETLSENLRLWDLMTVDLAHPDNPMADALKAQIISLGLFVRSHTMGLYAGTGSVDVLVDINTAILKGLIAQSTISQAEAPTDVSAAASQAA